MTMSDRRIAEVPTLLANVDAFTASVRACIANADASPDGRCGEHRHGRTGWAKPTDGEHGEHVSSK